MLNKITFLILIFASTILGQTIIHVKPFQNISIPSSKPAILNRVQKINGKYISLSPNVKNTLKVTTSLSNIQIEKILKRTGGFGAPVQLNLEGAIEEPGSYTLSLILNYEKDMSGGKVSISKVYKIEVDYPTFAAPFKLENVYYIRQKESFSFAINEYTDPTKYSFTITDNEGEINIKGIGAFVKLDNILQKDENYGKKITIVGKYNDEPFYYKDENGNLKLTKWQFEIDHPILDLKTNWVKNKKDSLKNVLNMQNVYSKAISFIYSKITPNDLIAFRPKIKGIKLTSVPANFLSSSKKFIVRKGNMFTHLIINTNESFWEEHDNDVPITITLKLKINTQLEHNKIYELRAKVINIKSNN